MASRPCGSRKNGFALIAVLWVMTGVAVLGATLTISAREAVATAQNRIDMLRAGWRAEACAEAARAVIDEALAADPPRSVAPSAWIELDSIVSRPLLVEGCSLSLRPSGMTIDVNGADSVRIRTVLLAIGQTAARADSLMAALLDWRDEDNAARSNGAEEAWYSAQWRPSPRNGPITSVDELRLVRGFDQIGGLDTLFGVDDERMYLAAAPLAILAALPGVETEATSVIAERRSRGVPIRDLGSLAARLPSNSRDSLLAHYSQLAQLTTSAPDAWTLTSRAIAGAPPLVSTVELRLVNAGRRAAIVRRRSWP